MVERDFIIPFVGLKNGIHRFEFDIDSSFFEDIENSLVENCDISVILNFEKSNNLFALEFKIDGKVELECDRCIEKYMQDIFGDYTVFVKFEEGNRDNEADVIYISREDTHLDIRELIYDYINLSIPLRRVHPLDSTGKSICNPVILEILENKKRSEENIEESDPRWDALKKIKSKK